MVTWFNSLTVYLVYWATKYTRDESVVAENRWWFTAGRLSVRADTEGSLAWQSMSLTETLQLVQVRGDVAGENRATQDSNGEISWISKEMV